MNSKDILILQKCITDIFTIIDYNFGMCVPMSCLLALCLKEKGLNVNICTGDLLYKGNVIFKQQENLNGLVIDRELTVCKLDWDGHCWIEFQDFLIDITIHRTVQMPEFNKTYKDNLVQDMKIEGHLRPIIMPKKQVLSNTKLHYITGSHLTNNKLIESFGMSIMPD